jgi:hypothetical protein
MPVVRLFCPLCAVPLALPVSLGYTLFLSVWGLGGFCFSPLKNEWGQPRYWERKSALPQSPTRLPDFFLLPLARLTQTLSIERRGVEIEEGGIKVKLTLVDTPGFGDSVDCSDW